MLVFFVLKLLLRIIFKNRNQTYSYLFYGFFYLFYGFFLLLITLYCIVEYFLFGVNY